MPSTVSLYEANELEPCRNVIAACEGEFAFAERINENLVLAQNCSICAKKGAAGVKGKQAELLLGLLQKAPCGAVVHLNGFEPSAPDVGGLCSIQLSYRCMSRAEMPPVFLCF